MHEWVSPSDLKIFKLYSNAGLFSCYTTRAKTVLKEITVLICEYFSASETGGNEVNV